DIELQDDGTYTGEIRRETKGGIDNNRNKNTRLEDQRVMNISFRGLRLLTPKLDMDWSVSYSKASEDRPNERCMDFRQKDVTMAQSFATNNSPLVYAVGGENPEKFELRSISEDHDYNREEESGAKINFIVPFSVINGEKGRLRFGALRRLKDKVRDNIFYSYEPIGDMGSLAAVQNVYWGGASFNPGAQD